MEDAEVLTILANEWAVAYGLQAAVYDSLAWRLAAHGRMIALESDLIGENERF